MARKNFNTRPDTSGAGVDYAATEYTVLDTRDQLITDPVVGCFKSTYTMAGTESAGEHVIMGEIPANTIVTDVTLICSAAVGSTATVDVGHTPLDSTGTGEDVDAFIDGATCQAARIQKITQDQAVGNVLLTTGKFIVLTFATLVSPGTPDIHLIVEYITL